MNQPAQHEPEQAAGGKRGQNLQVEGAPQGRVLRPGQMVCGGVLHRVEDAANAKRDERFDVAQGVGGQRGQAGLNRLGMQAQQRQQAPADQFFQLRERAEDRLQYGHIRINCAADVQQGLAGQAKAAAHAIMRRQRGQLFGLRQREADILTRSLFVAAPRRLHAVIVHHEGAGRRDLEEVPIVQLLKADVTGGQVAGVLVIARKMAPQRHSRSVYGLAAACRGQALAFVHGLSVHPAAAAGRGAESDSRAMSSHSAHVAAVSTPVCRRSSCS